MATLVRRALIVAAPDDVGEINLKQIDVHPGAPQLLGAGSCQVAKFADIGRRHYNDFLTLVAGPPPGPA